MINDNCDEEYLCLSFYTHIIFHFCAQVPDAMDYLLAEFHRVCIYTVPKHLHALNVSLHRTKLNLKFATEHQMNVPG
jgi:hypothetical protein